MRSAFEGLVDRVGGGTRVLIIAVGVLAMGLIFGVSQWASRPEWAPAFSGVPLENVGQMTDKLDQAGVKYKLERGGADILVATTDLAKARVALARGGMPNAGRPGLELFDQPSWGMTDFTQRINYRRALEGELERTIGKMRGVDAAQVHLVMHETQGFGAAEKPAEASIVIKLQSGAEPTPDVVKGIAHLAASSVDGLTSDHVTIVDDGGRLLSEGDEGQAETAEGMSSKQFQLEREVETYLRAKAERLLAQAVGAGNARVQVNAAINFDRIERRTEAMDPDKQVISSESKSEIVPGTQGGAAQTNTGTTYENSKLVETFSGAIGNLRRVTVAVLVAEKRDSQPGDKTTRSIPRTDAEIKQIEALVRTAVGLDSTRGDVVTVVSMPFDAPVRVIEPPARDLLQTMQAVQRPAIGVIGLLLAFILALLVLKALTNRPAQVDTDRVLTLPSGQPVNDTTYVSMPSTIVSVGSQLRDRIAASVDQQPDVAARMVRAWVKEG
ncbi:MAG: flagellar basal-body MS-ring/collar protein FliF [bacterium]